MDACSRGMKALQAVVGMMVPEYILDMLFSAVWFSLSSFWYGRVGILVMCSFSVSHISNLHSSSAHEPAVLKGP